jgi:hypothetical protein
MILPWLTTRLDDVPGLASRLQPWLKVPPEEVRTGEIVEELEHFPPGSG